MTSDPLVQQFLARQEDALAEAKRRYGSALRSLSLRILGSPEDAEEVENETYLEAWNQIPPAEPDSLKSYLYMICRRRSLDRLDEKLAKKRGGGEAVAALDEVRDTVGGEDGRGWGERLDRQALLNSFLAELPERERRIFLRRYWYFLSIREIAREEKLKESNVKVLLFRIRGKLKEQLQKEDLWDE